jgi:hypothetical protein
MSSADPLARDERGRFVKRTAEEKVRSHVDRINSLAGEGLRCHEERWHEDELKPMNRYLLAALITFVVCLTIMGSLYATGILS